MYFNYDQGLICLTINTSGFLHAGATMHRTGVLFGCCPSDSLSLQCYKVYYCLMFPAIYSLFNLACEFGISKHCWYLVSATVWGFVLARKVEQAGYTVLKPKVSKHTTFPVRKQ